MFNKRSLAYLTDWDAIDGVMEDALSPKFRHDHASPDGSPYLFSWFIYDHHEGFTNNPRFHDVGTHRIFDHYMDGLLKDNPFADGVYWHYHHSAISGDALESNTCWSNRTQHEEIVARRIIERNWYFSCFRAGLHIERNDVSHWLEMFFPFDFSARYSSDESVYYRSSDFDWRRCSDRWGAWHPDWYDYRREGDMKRYLFRCTDLWTYLSRLSDEEVSDAFEQARIHGSSVLTYYNHDYRDIRLEIDEGYDTIRAVAARYPNIEWRFVNASDAARLHLHLVPEKPGLSIALDGDLLTVRAKRSIFGPQPFLAIEEDGHFFRDNFNDEGANRWTYRLRNRNKVTTIGVAANSPSGNYDIFRKTL